MTDALLHLIGMAPVGAGHCQRLGKYLTLTPGVGTYHVAGLQDQRGVMAKPLRTLDLAQAVSVDRRCALATVGADSRTSQGMTVEGYTLAVTLHIVQGDMPLAAFFNHN